MSTTSVRGAILLGLSAIALAAAGCTNPDAATTTTGAAASSAPQNAGEPVAPAPRSPSAQAPTAVQRTPEAAVAAFAELYINWNYRTLASHQLSLAAMSVGPARLSERQAAASSQDDGTIARGRIYNRGQIVSVARDLARAGEWVLVTREQTGGDTRYEGLPAGYHVTVVQLATVPGGYAVQQWLPQS